MEPGNRCDSGIPEWLQKFKKNLVDDEIPLQGNSHASFSHETSLEPTTKRREYLNMHSVHTHCHKKKKITRFANGPKLQGPHAKNAMAMPYFKPQNFVTW